MTNNDWRQLPRTNVNRRSYKDIWIKRLDIIYQIVFIFHAMSISCSTAGLSVQRLEVMLRTATYLLAHIF
jgi:hypothetical protein